MNALTEQPPQVSRSRAIANVLQGSHETMLRPWRLIEGMRAGYPEWTKTTFIAADRPPSADSIRRPDAGGENARLRAQDILAALPPAGDLQEAIASLEELEAAPSDPAQIRVLISVMVDGYPNARPHNPEAYIEGLIHEITVAGYPVPIVAKACRTHVRESKFPPSIAELLEACEASRIGSTTLTLTRRALAVREAVQSALDEAERLGPRDLSEEWRTSLRAFAERGFWSEHYDGPRPGDARCRVPRDILAEFGFVSPAEEEGAIRF